MNAIDTLEQAIGSEYLLEDTQRQSLLSELKRAECSLDFTDSFNDSQVQPHTNTIAFYN